MDAQSAVSLHSLFVVNSRPCVSLSLGNAVTMAVMVNIAPRASIEPTTAPVMIHLVFEDPDCALSDIGVFVVVMGVLKRMYI